MLMTLGDIGNISHVPAICVQQHHMGSVPNPMMDATGHTYWPHAVHAGFLIFQALALFVRELAYSDVAGLFTLQNNRLAYLDAQASAVNCSVSLTS